MNTKGLARLYDRLTVWERIPLLIAAEARGDDPECQRLFHSSPLRTWQFSEHLLAEQALHVLAMIYIGEQLDAAASYFFAVMHLGDEDDPRPEDWLRATEACAYFFTANADAWRRFCEGLGIDSDALTAANHQGWFLNYCEEHMPAHAPTVEAMRDRFRETGRDDAELVTADSLLVSLRELLDQMTAGSGRVVQPSGAR